MNIEETAWCSLILWCSSSFVCVHVCVCGIYVSLCFAVLYALLCVCLCVKLPLSIKVCVCEPLLAPNPY